MTYAAPLKATLRFVVWEDLDDGERRPRDIIEKEVYLGDLPLLTDLGTFIVNGAERVVVSQLHRSPGVVFEQNIHPNGTKLHSARIIPFRGSWVEFTVDINNVCYVHIDKKKFPATALLRAFGFGTDEDIYNLFFSTREVAVNEVVSEALQTPSGSVLAEDVVDTETGEVLLEATTELGEGDIEILVRAEAGTVRGLRYRIRRCREPDRQTHPWRKIPPSPKRPRFFRSIRSCVQARHPTSRLRAARWKACSSTRGATTSAVWAATRSTSGSESRRRLRRLS